MACIDGLTGFAEAIHAACLQINVQLCVAHLVRVALRYVSTQNSKAVTADLKKIYQAADSETRAEHESKSAGRLLLGLP